MEGHAGFERPLRPRMRLEWLTAIGLQKQADRIEGLVGIDLTQTRTQHALPVHGVGNGCRNTRTYFRNGAVLNANE